MAQRLVTVLTDDLTGEKLEVGETVTFALDGVEYEIDLGEAQAEKLRGALARYIQAGRRIGGRSTRSGRRAHSADSESSSRKSGGSSRDTKAIREWAQANGRNVSERGRSPASVVEAYEAAH